MSFYNNVNQIDYMYVYTRDILKYLLMCPHIIHIFKIEVYNSIRLLNNFCNLRIIVVEIVLPTIFLFTSLLVLIFF